jgi:hypothetical protein
MWYVVRLAGVLPTNFKTFNSRRILTRGAKVQEASFQDRETLETLSIEATSHQAGSSSFMLLGEPLGYLISSRRLSILDFRQTKTGLSEGFTYVSFDVIKIR